MHNSIKNNFSALFLKIVASLFFLYALFTSYNLRWVSDDAFISFRYARNLVNGLGLVFNDGEKVEGYTNFLWTILLTIPHFLNSDPVIFSEILGILFFMGTLATLLVFSKNLSDSKKIFIPIAFVGLSVHKHSLIFATSGLETSMFTFFITSGIVLFISSENHLTTTISFFLLVLSVLTRPDGLIIYGVVVSYYIIRDICDLLNKKISLKTLIGKLFVTQLPFLFLLVPCWTLKSIYYNSFFPNTFYAKSADLSYFSQGFTYLFLYFNSYYVFYLIPIFFPVIFFKKEKNIPIHFRKNLKSILFLTIPCIAIYIFFVIKVGGDFMFSRFFIPITPLLYITLELLFYNLPEISKLQKSVFPVLVISLTILFYNPYKGRNIPIIEGISNENEIYKREFIEHLTARLKNWRNIFVQNKINIAFGGSQGIFAYYLESPLAIEAETGLTDYYISHLPLLERGRIGHEKKSPIPYLQKRNIHLHLNLSDGPDTSIFQSVKIKDFPGEWKIINYDKDVMRSLLKNPDFSLTKK